MSNAPLIKPDYLVVGTMKSGTSTLADYLAMHPSIHVAPNEVHYFDKDVNFERGPEWYSDALKRGCPADQLESMIFGEKTPTYSYQLNCANRIQALVPDVKLIWIFRDPVKRAFSNYLHRRKKGEDLLEFDEAVAREVQRMQEHRFFGYVERSKYVKQVERFLELYPIEQMHFMLFEDLVAEPLAELNKVASFLGQTPFSEPLGEVHSNSTRMPLSRRSLWFVGQTLGYEHYLYKVTRTLNTIVTREKPSFPKHLRPQLVEEFRPYNERLAELTGLNVDVWHK